MPHHIVDRSVTGDVLIDELDRLAMLRGYPAVLRCDNGPGVTPVRLPSV